MEAARLRILLLHAVAVTLSCGQMNGKSASAMLQSAGEIINFMHHDWRGIL